MADPKDPKRPKLSRLSAADEEALRRLRLKLQQRTGMELEAKQVLREFFRAEFPRWSRAVLAQVKKDRAKKAQAKKRPAKKKAAKKKG